MTRCRGHGLHDDAKHLFGIDIVSFYHLSHLKSFFNYILLYKYMKKQRLLLIKFSNSKQNYLSIIILNKIILYLYFLQPQNNDNKIIRVL